MTRRKMTFEEWKAQIDRVLWAKVGVSSEDLPDVDYKGWYDDGVTANIAAARVINYELSGRFK